MNICFPIGKTYYICYINHSNMKPTITVAIRIYTKKSEALFMESISTFFADELPENAIAKAREHAAHKYASLPEMDYDKAYKATLELPYVAKVINLDA